MSSDKVLTLHALNPSLLKAQYAVRGEIVQRAEEHALTLQSSTAATLPFNHITRCNIGNPQALGQRPITFFRQVMSMCLSPMMMDIPEVVNALPVDVIARAKEILKMVPTPGAYSNSMGVKSFRESVANFIEDRDGVASNPDDIFLTNGASSGINYVLTAILESSTTGVLCPTPQYPIYSALLALLNGTCVPYYTDENNEWAIDITELDRALTKARSEGTAVKALVIINPGNPTGSCLSENGIKELILYCKKERLVILADEVYQTNIYRPDTHPFVSFKKVLHSLGAQAEGIELISFHSVSKGMIGECGIRGGYMELVGIDPEVKAQLYKAASINLCPNLPGQIMVNLMCNPPREGDESFPSYQKELKDIYESLRRRSIVLVDTLNAMEGITCNAPVSSMYVFPRIRLPTRVVAAASAIHKLPDAFYCLKLLDATGVCVVPGSGFGQIDGTWHFRCTFLPPEDNFKEFLTLIQDFHNKFMDEYRD